MKQRNPYTVPDGYLSELEERIFERVEVVKSGEQYVEQETQSWGSAWKRLIGFAAGFALLVGFGWTMVYLTTDKETLTAVSDNAADQSLTDTERLLWVLDDQEVIDVVESKSYHHNYLAQVAEDYLAFYGEADDVNLFYYD